MGFVMALVAGTRKEILAAIAAGDWVGLDDRSRFAGHLALGGALDPTWLDLFSEAVRAVTDRGEPLDFLDARTEIEEAGPTGERTVERVDPMWITAGARLGGGGGRAVGPPRGGPPPGGR